MDRCGHDKSRPGRSEQKFLEPNESGPGLATRQCHPRKNRDPNSSLRNRRYFISSGSPRLRARMAVWHIEPLGIGFGTPTIFPFSLNRFDMTDQPKTLKTL